MPSDLTQLDENAPDGATQPVSILDDIDRETRSFLKGWAAIEHGLAGRHKFSVGATSQRPTTNLERGTFFVNTDTGNLEYWSGSVWVAVAGGGGGPAPTLVAPLPGSRLQRSITTGPTTIALIATAIELVSVFGDSFGIFEPPQVNVDIALAGPAAGGRDQANAFAPSTWIHLYWIYNKTTSTLSGIASSAAFGGTGALTFPAGFTLLTYAGAIRVSAAGLLEPMAIVGRRTIWANGGVTVLAGGTNPGPAAIDISAAVPPNADWVFGTAGLDTTATAVGAPVVAIFRLEPAANVATQGIGIGVTPTVKLPIIGPVDFPNNQQSVDYALGDPVFNPIPGLAATLVIDAFENPNGG